VLNYVTTRHIINNCLEILSVYVLLSIGFIGSGM